MLRGELRRLWAVPRAPDPPARAGRDWALLAAGLAAAGVEAAARDDVVWPAVSLAVTAAMCVLTLWRRTHPLATVALAYGAGIALTLADLAAGHERPAGLYTGMVVLVLVYALLRWGSGRDVALGCAVILAAFGLSLAVDDVPPADYAGSLLFLAFPGVLGAAVRAWSTARRRELERMRASEREALARELHDTVAHHVSAIVVRAQAGRVLAAADPAAALPALEGVEEEGARTLEAMRAMVSALRDATAGLAPLAGVADLRRLAGEARLPVGLELDGPLDDLPPAVDGAVYRVVQESLTNALRHAQHATAVRVRVAAEAGRVRVTVRDDGAGGRRGKGRAGFGLTGLRERVTLLGGALSAGPAPDRGGWLVEAQLPLGKGVRGADPRARR
ncbi:sensor histidine kinase [Dactylosporangium salmoneum]|uniref:histidine kinase n=1 Tax=Dactylosporangium salmoneum TaxID=53361 RepID=A0ABP5VB74_9ACTN